uniref:Uncharacterized protein n=1 Tax=Strongyloides stercoralis TaxID=6248 RepID=A0A0K0DTZ1_STRER
MTNNTTNTSSIETTIAPKIQIESIYLLFDSETWNRKIIQLNIIFILGIFLYIFCFCYIIIIKRANHYIYKYKTELVYEIRTEPTDEDTYKCIFSPDERLAYYANAKRRLTHKTKIKRNKEREISSRSRFNKGDEDLKTAEQL